MWVVVLCFVLPAVLFSVCALLAWLRVLHVNRTREKTECAEVLVNDELIRDNRNSIYIYIY
uniref:Secreted protein n=1 Tax=Heterorhabditis bacteriophora TaxID=37862 RepID=A0A1I7X8L6_HETBA